MKFPQATLYELDADAPDATVKASMYRWPAVAYAFQPIVDVQAQQVISYEALVRGSLGEPAPSVLAQVPLLDMHAFDMATRSLAMFEAMQLGLPCDLNLNFLPGSLLDAKLAPLDATLDAARRCGLPADRIVIEITESELIHDLDRFALVIQRFRASGIRFSIDDFGAGYSGLNLLASFQPDQLKLDMALVRGVASNGPRQAIVRAIASVCLDLGIDLVAEGVETLDEFRWLQRHGVQYFQGYLFAKPGFCALPAPVFPPEGATV